MPASGVPCPGSKDASVKIIHVLFEASARILGSSQVNMARYKLNALTAFGDSFWPTLLYACSVTTAKQVLDILPKSWPAENCIRPLSFSASRCARFLDSKIAFIADASSVFLVWVLSNLTMPRCKSARFTRTPKPKRLNRQWMELETDFDSCCGHT